VQTTALFGNGDGGRGRSGAIAACIL